jgi:hypothetical protein
MKYTINELANSKGVSQPVREALLHMEAELEATNRQVEILSDALAESRRQRQWVGLTDEERMDCIFATNWSKKPLMDTAKLIEAKLKEKNT